MKKAFTLIELMVAVGIIVILTAIAIPSFSALIKSYSSSMNDTAIDSLLCGARSIAVRDHQYTGVRFQRNNNKQFAVIIQHNPALDDDPGDTNEITYLLCSTVPGTKPCNLGDRIGILPDTISGKSKIDANDFCATVMFSGQGKLCTKDVKVWPKLDGDDVFNPDRDPLPMDDYESKSCLSLRSLDIEAWQQAVKNNTENTFIAAMKQLLINAYTGEVIR
jgi:prepilin-type N-terminal cleavage/methylation domain-containing protein